MNIQYLLALRNYYIDIVTTQYELSLERKYLKADS
jgi:hypothetical protein